MHTCICILGTVVTTAHFWHSCSPCPDAAVHLHAVGVASRARLYLEPAVGIVFALPQCRCTSQALCPHLVAHPMRNCISIQSTIVSICRFWHGCKPCPDTGTPPHAAGAGPAPMQLHIPCTIASASWARLFLQPVFGIVVRLAPMQLRISMR